MKITKPCEFDVKPRSLAWMAFGFATLSTSCPRAAPVDAAPDRVAVDEQRVVRVGRGHEAVYRRVMTLEGRARVVRCVHGLSRRGWAAPHAFVARRDQVGGAPRRKRRGAVRGAHGGVHFDHVPPVDICAPPTTTRSTSINQPAPLENTSWTVGSGPAPTGTMIGSSVHERLPAGLVQMRKLPLSNATAYTVPREIARS